MTAGLLALALAGCGGSLDRESYDAVESGMTEERVIRILGEPDRSRSIGVGDISGTHLSWDGDGFTVSVQLVDGKVVSKQWLPSSE